MNITDEQLDALAKEYAKEKSSSEVFRTAHENDFKAGFSKALSLFAVSKCDEFERETSCKHSDWTDLYYSSGDYYGRYCNDCGEFFE